MQKIPTAALGSGQQCIAAPAWIAARLPVSKGNLATSTLTSPSFLQVEARLHIRKSCLIFQHTKQRYVECKIVEQEPIWSQPLVERLVLIEQLPCLL